MATFVSWIFAIPRSSDDCHNQLHTTLRRNGIKCFVHSNQARSDTSRNSILFLATGTHIIARTTTFCKKIVMREELLNIVEDQLVDGKVILSNLQPMTMTRDEIASFKVLHNRLPSKKESTRYALLTGVRFEGYILRLFQKNGMDNVEFSYKQVESIFLVQKINGKHQMNKKIITAFEVSFSARVADLSAFSSAWKYGIGRYRSYGCGMLRIVEHPFEILL